MPAFPVAKLVVIFVKQVSKPLANFAKERAKNNHFFRTYICMPPAQFYHWCEVRMKMYVMNIGRTGEKSTIPKLNEQAAIELGANLLGEGVIFMIAVTVLGFEYNRQKVNEKNKEQMEQDHLVSLENKLNDLAFASEELDTKIRELTRIIYAQSNPASRNTQGGKASTNPSASNQTTNIHQKGVVQIAIEDAQSRLKKV